MCFCAIISSARKQKCDVVTQWGTNQPHIVLGGLDYQTAGKELGKKGLKRNQGGEASKGVVERAGLCWRWGGERSEVSSPSDISCAREAVTTRSAEVQVSERDDWLTRASGTSPALRPARTFHPSFPPFPRHSSVTHPSLPSNSLRSPRGLPSHRTPNPVILSSFPSFLSPHSPSFSPLKLNITTGFHSAGRADWGSSLRGCMSSVRHHALTFTLRNIHVHLYAHRLLACSLNCDRNIQSISGVFTFWVLFLELLQSRLCWKSGHHQTKTSPLDKEYDHDCERKFCTTAEHLYFKHQDCCPTMHLSYKAREVTSWCQ